jgi:hypothetical protein
MSEDEEYMKEGEGVKRKYVEVWESIKEYLKEDEIVLKTGLFFKISILTLWVGLNSD